MTAADAVVEYKDTLLGLARTTIDTALTEARTVQPDPADYPEPLRAERASFVTLLKGANRDLRGCIGSLQAQRPLVVDVATNAVGAAFHDPRFPPLQASEWPDIQIKIEVLTPAEPIDFTDETDLVDQLRPGQDGVILQAGPHQGTFLPTVWESLPEPWQFWGHLRRKAGLPAEGPLPTGTKVWRYGTVVLS